jgi:hypothetical protein
VGTARNRCGDRAGPRCRFAGADDDNDNDDDNNNNNGAVDDTADVSRDGTRGPLECKVHGHPEGC